MMRRYVLAAGAAALLAGLAVSQTAAAQPAPSATATTTAAPGTAPPGGSWGTGIPGGQPAAQPGVQPAPYPPGYGQPQPGYPPGAYPPGAYPPGAYPQGGYPGPGGVWTTGEGGEPMMMGPDGRPRLLPLEMPYDPDKGIPPGYKLAEKRRTALAIAGGATFGGLWVISCIAGGFIEDNGQWNGDRGWPMYIPVLGPFITIGTAHTGPAPTTILIFDGLAQGASVAMFIAGMASSQQVLKYQFAGTDLTVKPIASPTQNGGYAGLSGSF